MILHLAHLPVPKLWKQISALGDDSFVKSAGEKAFASGGTPLHAMNLIAGEDGTLLKIKGPVVPHTDDYIGRNLEAKEGEPQGELSVFWLTKLAKSKGAANEFWLQCGAEYCRMSEGDFVVFPHSVTHSVITSSNWEGIAWQLGSYERVPGLERFLAASLPTSRCVPALD